MPAAEEISGGELAEIVRGLPGFAELAKALRSAEVRPDGPLVVTGAAGSLPGLLAAALARDFAAPIFAVVPDESFAETLASDAAAAGLSEIAVAPEPSLTPYQRVVPSLKFRKAEFSLMAALGDNDLRLAVIPARFLLARLPDPHEFSRRRLSLTVGEETARELVIEHLVAEGYRRADLVGETGDFAVRGGIIDVFPPEASRPIRIEYDGDAVASIRTFDSDTQRSQDRLPAVSIGPIASATASEASERRLAERLRRRPTESERALFLPAVSELSASLLDFSPEAPIVVCEPGLVEKALCEWSARIGEDYDPEVHPASPAELFHDLAGISSRLSVGARVVFDRLGLSRGPRISIDAEESPAFDGRVADAAREIASALAAGGAVTVVASAKGGAEKIRRFLAEYELSPVSIVSGRIARGVRLRAAGRLLMSEEEIFGPETSVDAPRRRTTEAFVSDLRDLKAGDFVVHSGYGVGRFRGLKRFPVEGAEREFVEIVYADDRALLLPVERLDLLQKYAGADGGAPRLDRLGGATWDRKKQAARKAIKDLSDELLKLYARRAQAQGFAFSRDSPWQKEFEDAFEFVETPDQAQAIVDVKRDLERPAPMDRLLCGDVGYGKTEVAMRAAFKAVLDGKQVAVLAPTTILADQHYRTFRRRFAAFPVTIELLSRFRDRAEQKEVAAKAADGSVDIVIATHRLLSKDVRFRDLGLLVIDEEQRFGVAQKERLKELRASIDVLSMSATPIPRSLHLSLSGIRDLSIIETPPRNRLAIDTQIVPKSPEAIREAISFELDRGGQVFYVHNRIESIGAEKEFLQELLPNARITVGHGRMAEGNLERAMADFVARNTDILLATAIVENGLDIPSVNTILIDRADMFGLSQLYQLRGRVGRSDKAAFCYLLVADEARLTEEARLRLATIREFCDLGAGFRIAAKDLEIRGSGNILGGEQSGQIAAVGFEMYMNLLEEAIREGRGEEPAPERSVSISLGEDVSIPVSYLPDESLRLSLYKRVARARDDEELAALAAETEDRFGPPPAALERLFEYGRLRRRAERLAIKSIDRRGGRYRLRFDEATPVDPVQLAEILGRVAGATVVPPATVSLPGEVPVSRLVELLDLVRVERAA